MGLRRLPQNMINKIAAGEVIERPAAVVKELVENSIDAGATSIEVHILDGGQSLISVADDGCGMSVKELSLSVERHATSKLPDDDLINIRYLGFRGEALPSIGAVSQLEIISRTVDAENGWRIKVEGGMITDPEPVAASRGTLVKVSNLFFATPARLKFLKSARTEQNRIIEIFKRIAMANPKIAFTLSAEKKQIFNFLQPIEDLLDERLRRLTAIIGSDFAKNTIEVSASRDGFNLTGYAGLPTFNRSNSSIQFLFVNSRPVTDRMLFGALRGAYQGFLASNRYPIVALFLKAPPDLVDVNVHPSKTEVRFQDQGLVRGLIVGAIKHALSEGGFKTSTTVTEAALGAMKAQIYQNIPSPLNRGTLSNKTTQTEDFQKTLSPPTNPNDTLPFIDHAPSAQNDTATPSHNSSDNKNTYPLGVARGQLHETYIIAQSDDGIIIVDQHAAHERLVEEKIKESLSKGRLKTQCLLIPEVIDLTPEDCDHLITNSNELTKMGLVFEKFGASAIIVRETPALLGEFNIKGLFQDLADDIKSYNEALTLKDRINSVSATMACHWSIRAGRRLNADEMNSLLREMEATPHSGQCSHGRPTYVEIKLNDIEKLFGRT